MNHIALLGRISFIETTTKGDMAICKFSVAVNRRSNKGENTADFIPCVAFGKTAENISKFFEKGSLILIEGALQSNRYEKDGKNVTSYSVIVNGFHFTGAKESGSKPEEQQEEASCPFDL